MAVPLGTAVWLTAENAASRKRREKYAIEHVLTRGEVEFKEYRVQKPTENAPQRAEDKVQALSERVKLLEITKEGQRVVLCQGGFGGRGNVAFKGSTNRTPLEAEYGTFGEQKQVTLELKLLADVGLVGYPNAGKSTLLSKVTRAHPKIADYPFTTLEPNLGVLALPGGGDVVVADIPGLIEGASEGAGLGTRFLGHVERCRVLVHLVDGTEDDVAAAYRTVRRELEAYGAGLAEKPELVALNKTDALTADAVRKKRRELKKASGRDVAAVSAVSGDGLKALTVELAEVVRREKAAEHQGQAALP